MEFASRLAWLDASPLHEINRIKGERLKSGRDLIDLSMVNPDILPATFIIDKLHEFSIKPFNHRYAVSRGIRKLREAIASKYRSRFGVDRDPESEICAALGSKDALQSILSVLCSRDDYVLIGRPTYPVYLSLLKILGLQPVFFEVTENEDRMFDNIRTALSKQKVRALLLNFPNNPTGICVTSKFYEALSKIPGTEGACIINDFAYGEMGFDREPVSLLSSKALADRSVETFTLSKAYSVPGWRVGAILGSREIVQRVALLKSHVDYGLFLPLQLAAAAVLSSKRDFTASVVGQYKNRMKVLARELSENGWEIRIPHAGASLWTKIPRCFEVRKSIAFTEMVLEKTGVCLMPGLLYGNEYDEFVRFALVASEEKMHDVAGRIIALETISADTPASEGGEGLRV